MNQDDIPIMVSDMLEPVASQVDAVHVSIILQRNMHSTVVLHTEVSFYAFKMYVDFNFNLCYVTHFIIPIEYGMFNKFTMVFRGVDSYLPRFRHHMVKMLWTHKVQPVNTQV